MRKRSLAAMGAAAAVVLAAGGFGLWLATLPSDVATAAPPVPPSEAAATLAALRPPHGVRPVVAIIGLNDATETTDYLMTAGILRRADVADVVLVATEPGPVQLYPALKVEPDATIAQFDAGHPHGADYVIVPAMSRDDDPAVLAWLRRQSAKGAIVIGVCAGAKVVAAAGLLDGKRATTHWYYLKELLARTPTVVYVADRRIVSDGDVTTTTGVSASMPMMLTLVEAIAGRERAEAVARDLGLEGWDARHASDAFRLTRPFVTTVLANRLAFWNREELGIPLVAAMDEVSLALVADAWSRTYRSHAASLGRTASAVTTANGVRVLPDRVVQDWPEEGVVSTFPDQPPAAALDLGLGAIAARYGARTADVVAMQLEYPRPASAR